MCYKRRAPGLPADSSGETACRAAFSSVFFYCRCRFSPRPPKDELAYAVGARLGTRLQQEMPDLELSELLLGLRQAYRGEALEIPPERIEKLLLQHENATTETPRITPAEARFLANEKARFGVRELTGGVLVSELRRGQGNGIGAATQVHVRYRGLLADGQVFDQSESAEWFALDSVIEGWRTALRAMPVGARWRVVIPSTQAYGHEGAGDLIPPDAPLVFEIDLLGVR
ncbi:TPA: FKBP-type peptidyl-prolyl cis-trans isomerase [Pseudomonas aeruginosa]|nr:FKBP-type peptidyl-prolyl cis-trans isomerase [Pseudomonas aeruginosa]